MSQRRRIRSDDQDEPALVPTIGSIVPLSDREPQPDDPPEEEPRKKERIGY